MRLREFVYLWQVSRRRLISEEDYRQFQAFQAKQVQAHLASHAIHITHHTLLDLGSGIGGYSQEFARSGAKVTSLDLVQPQLPNNPPVDQVQATAMSIPMKDNSVDIIICASLIEHVSEPRNLLSEIERALKPGGCTYISFPPYYSPIGGHEYSPFHYLGESIALRLVRRQNRMPAWVRRLYNAPENIRSFSEMYQGWGLHKMTIKKFRTLVKGTSLAYKGVSTRYMPVSFIRWPVLSEILSWHAQFILVKPANANITPS